MVKWWTNPKSLAWEGIRLWGDANSNGCTGVVDVYTECCLLHDFLYKTGIVSRSEADWMFHECVQSRSPLRKWSLVGWVRWIGVRIGGYWAWKKHRRSEREDRHVD